MNSRKSIFTLLLAVMLVISMVISGCGASEDAQPSTSAEESSISNSTTVAQETALPPVKLIWYVLLPEQQDQEKVFAKANEYIKSKINADVEFRAFGWGNYEDKVKTAIAASEEFDMMWIASWMVKYQDMANRGALLPLDTLLDKYAQGTKSLMNQKIWDLSKVKDVIYGVPCYQIFSNQGGVWFKKELVDKYKFDTASVTKWSDVEPFLKMVKDGEKEITPLAANNQYLSYFQGDETFPQFSKKLQYVGPSTQIYADNPTKVLSDNLDDGAKDLLLQSYKAMRDWYLKGYVRKDLFSIKDVSAEIKAGKFACGFTTYKPGVEAELKDGYGFDVVAVPLGTPKLAAVQNTLLSISATSKNPERTMMLIEMMMMDKYLFNLMANGIEGEHYIKTGENRISRVESNKYQPGIDWALGNTTLGYIIPGKPDDVYELTKKINNEAELDIYPDFSFDPEKVKNEKAAIDAIVKELGEPMGAGVLDPDKYLPIMVEKMKKAGIEKVKVEVQRQLDEYLVKNKK